LRRGRLTTDIAMERLPVEASVCDRDQTNKDNSDETNLELATAVRDEGRQIDDQQPCASSETTKDTAADVSTERDEHCNEINDAAKPAAIYVSDAGYSPLLINRKNIEGEDRSEPEFASSLRKSSANVETFRAPSNDEFSDINDAELTVKTGERQIWDRQQSTGQVTSVTGSEDAAAAAASSDNNVDVVVPTDASLSVLGLTPADKHRTTKADASCSPLAMGGDKTTTVTSGADKSISKTELPPLQLDPSTAAVETLCPVPAEAEEPVVNVPLLNSAREMRPGALEIDPVIRAAVDDVDNNAQNIEPQEQSCIPPWLEKTCRRVTDILKVPAVLIFGIVLYLLDVGSDIAAGVMYFRDGHRVWGSLTISFVLLSAVCWAAVSLTWWYYDDNEDHRSYRRKRMALSVLLLDPIVR